VFARFAPEERMQLYGRGIRRRLAPMLGDRRHEELAHSVLFALPGAPVIRYGDELGMGDDLDLEEREAVRTPMQWSDAPQGGFTTSKEPAHPVIDEGVWSYRHVNVAAQRRKPESFLNWTAKMIRLRKECPEIGWGNCTILDTGSPHVLALRYDWRGKSLITVHNFSGERQQVRIEPDVPGAERLSSLMADVDLTSDDEGVHHIPLDALGYCWYRVGGLDYALEREPEKAG
jgi:maltose alpha-D-glucosyltransferase / alpha-amylase